MFNFLFPKSNKADLLTSELFDEKSFYRAFLRDLKKCKNEIIIESPYITSARMNMFIPIFKKLVTQSVKVYIITRNPREHDERLEPQAEREIRYLEEIGVQVLICTGNHHRKLAIIDREILWEGSLNILSQASSREIMRRIGSKELTMQMFDFLRLDRFI